MNKQTKILQKKFIHIEILGKNCILFNRLTSDRSSVRMYLYTCLLLVDLENVCDSDLA